MKIAIIEDEQIHIDFLAKCLQEWGGKRKIPVSIRSCPSAESFLFIWEETKDFDILFVDIQMKAMNGMEMVRRIRREDENIPIVFTTGIADYMAEGYEVDAMHYLLKPVDREKVALCMDKLARRRRSEPFVSVRRKEESIKLPTERIMYIEAQGHGCVAELYTRAGETQRIEIAESITEMEKRLMPYDFLRCHRSYLCRVGSIHQIGKTEIIFDNGSRIPVSRRMYEQVNRAFIRHFQRIDSMFQGTEQRETDPRPERMGSTL